MLHQRLFMPFTIFHVASLLQGIPHRPWVWVELSSSMQHETATYVYQSLCVPVAAPILHKAFSVQGIPPQYRPWVWMELSGGKKRRSEHMASYYEAMVDMGESSSEFTHQIELVWPLT